MAKVAALALSHEVYNAVWRNSGDGKVQIEGVAMEDYGWVAISRRVITCNNTGSFKRLSRLEEHAETIVSPTYSKAGNKRRSLIAAVL